MNLFKCAFVAFCAILLCGCLESKGEFEAINLGKVSAVYKNETLKILDSHPTPSLKEESNANNPSLRGESYIYGNQPTLSLRDSRSESWQSTTPSLRESQSDSWQSIDNQKDTAPFALFFFTTTCGVCKAQIPILQEIADELADENTKIYGILGNAPSADLAQKYAKSNAITLPIFYESKAKRFFTQIIGGVKGVPVIVIFKDGKIKERFIGLIPKGILKKALAK